MARRHPHVVGFDDAPFEPEHRGDVRIVGVVYAGPRLEGVLSGRVRRDGANATRMLSELVLGSRFHPQLHAVLLQGIAFAGFNVVDLHALAESIERPVVAVSRRSPDLSAIRRALLDHVRGGRRKWRLIERAGVMERTRAGLWIQRAGLSLAEAERMLEGITLDGKLPEPLRVAHLIAAGVTTGESRGRP